MSRVGTRVAQEEREARERLMPLVYGELVKKGYFRFL
jgi:hypothetical protein